MFISIPKEFFVPVIFGEGFILNEENNNLELDTAMYRESTKVKGEGNISNYNILANINSEKMLEKMDMEKITDKQEKSKESDPIYIALNKEEDIDDKCVENIFENIDDEYINSLNDKKICDM